MTSHMKLQQLRYFVAVYEAGSITAGATRAFATQSGLSMQIKDLESQLGGALFERSASGVQATEMGRRFYEHATSILRGVSEAEQAMKAMQGEVSGSVRAGVIPTLTRAILPPVLIRFSERYPLVNVSVVEAYSAQLTDDVLQGELDFAVVPAPNSDQESSARSHYLATDQEFLVSAPDKIGAHLQPVDLTRHGPQKLVLPGVRNARRAKLEAYLHNQGVEIGAIIELDGMLATLELVANTDWKTILPGLLCITDREGKHRQLNPLLGAPLHVDYVLIEPSASSLSTAAQLFADMFKQELESHINWYED
jgi:LysR family transcriptional regulator, nitrogen assimilation regulatory protein